MTRLDKIKAIIDNHCIPCAIADGRIEVRAYMDSDDISDIITCNGSLEINGKTDNLYAWLGY